MSEVMPRPGRIEVAGLFNLRDVGGYPAGAGSTRPGRLYRSDSPHRLDTVGRDEVGALGIRHVIDLRGDREVLAAPSPFHEGSFTVHRVPIEGDTGVMDLSGDDLLGRAYDHMLDRHAPKFADAVGLIATLEPGAVLVHCMAGKDRTGIVVALALLAAGVDRAAVVADYAATELNLRGRWTELVRSESRNAGLTFSPATRDLLASPAVLIERIIDRLDTEYGGATSFLQFHGVDDAAIARLRASLITGPVTRAPASSTPTGGS